MGESDTMENAFFDNLRQLKRCIWILFAIFFCIVITTAILNYKDQMILFAAFYTLAIIGFVLFTYAKYFKKVSQVNDDLLIGGINENGCLHLSEIMLKEFDYAHDTASQAMNDRHTIVNSFFIITGVIVTLIGMCLKNEATNSLHNIPLVFVILLSFNFIGGFIS
jgi:hypothetical protein